MALEPPDRRQRAALPPGRRPPATDGPTDPEQTRSNIRAIFHRAALRRARRRLPPS